MATGIMTLTTADKHIGEVWPGDVIRAQEFNLVVAPRVFRDWKFVGYGDVYHFPRVPNIESESKTSGTALTLRNYTDTEQTITINVLRAAAFEIEDIIALLANTALANEMKRSIGYSIGRALDVELALLANTFSTSVGTLGVELTYDNLVSAWAALSAVGIDTNSNCSWFMSPGAVAGLLKQDIFISQLYQGNNPRAVETAKVGQVLGAPVFMTPLTNAPSAGQSDSWVTDRRGTAAIMAQNLKMVSEYRASDLATIIAGYQVWGTAEIDRYSETPGNITATDTWSVRLRTVA